MNALFAHKPTVYAVDDDPIVRILLEALFEGASIPVETYASAEEFLDAYNSDNPGCLLLDIVMPGMSGIELQQVLTALGNETPIIFLTGTAQVQVAVEILKAGAVDLIEKPIEPAIVLDCVKKAIGIDLQIRYDRSRQTQIKQRIDLLTPREHEVMKLMVEGKTSKESGTALGISSRTVEVYRKNVIDKMHANSAIDLATTLMKITE